MPVRPMAATLLVAVAACQFSGAAVDGAEVDGGRILSVDAAPEADAMIDAASTLRACFTTYTDLRIEPVGYKVLTQARTYDNARLACEAEGGRLAVLETAAEAAAINAYLEAQSVTDVSCPGLGFQPCAWAGLRQDTNATAQDEGWRWEDGFDRDSRPDEPAWALFEPNDGGTLSEIHLEDCAELVDFGQLNDLNCTIQLPAVCECQPL